MNRYLLGPGEEERVAFTLGLVAQRTPIKGLRVLDLACRTGAFSTAFARKGAKVLGLEGRQENLDHAPKSRARYILGDVRDLSPKLGTFDVTLCLGILYHLGPEDALRLLRAMREVTHKFAVLDTHVGHAYRTISIEGRGYTGEENGESTGHPWSSIGNQSSFWFTPDSLDDLLRVAGWDIEHVTGKGWSGERDDRRWIILS